MRTAGSLEKMLALACRELTLDEKRYLVGAASAKLLELATSRAYELDLEDCRFIRRVYGSFRSSQFRGRSVANWAYRASLFRLLRMRRFGRARALLSIPLICRVVALRLLQKAGLGEEVSLVPLRTIRQAAN